MRKARWPRGTNPDAVRSPLRVAACWLMLFVCGVAIDAFAQGTDLPRHTEETRALTQPQEVLQELPQRIAAAQRQGDDREVALLRLAESNACRVLSRTQCQQDAAVAARTAAERAQATDLIARGNIMAASAAISMQDFDTAQRFLEGAEDVLRAHPHPLLQADVRLAYSSIALSLSDAKAAAQHAREGLASLGDVSAATIRVRLLRNLARALTADGDLAEAETALDGALELAVASKDPRLQAELHLQGAHIASLRRDFTDAAVHGEAVLAIGQALQNAQLRGQGQEALARAAAETGAQDRAVAWWKQALAEFGASQHARDERRVLRELLPRLVETDDRERHAAARRLVALESELEAKDKASQARDFESRLSRLEEHYELGLMRQGMEAAQRQRQLMWVVIALVGLLSLLLAAFAVFQRLGRRRLQAAFALSQENELRYMTLTDNLPASVAEVDADQRYVQVNAHLAQSVGRAPADILGKTVREVRGETIHAQWQPHLEAALRGEVSRVSVKSLEGDQPVFLNTIFVPKRSADGRVIGAYALTFDVTELRLAQEELEGLARIDSLTGIANRRHFEERMVAVLAHARRTKRTVALLAIDVDNFKAINDTHGHGAGDTVLREVVNRMGRCIRKDDFLARLGGDEFILLVEEPPQAAGEIIAKKLLKCVDQPIDVDGLAVTVGFSIGVAYGDGDSTPEALRERADQALYEAKRAGKGTYRVRIDPG